MDRRHFLKTGAALALSGPAALSARPAFAAGYQEGMRVGLIGCGWYGKTDLFRLIQVAPVEVVSLCDVDAEMLSGAAAMVAQRQRSGATPRTFPDYREMLGQRNLDVVLVATPDHWHALPAIAAMQAGADVWVQKPISVDVVEGQAMLAAARKYERVVQVGTQRRSTPHIVEARELLRSGRLGTVGLVEAYSYYHMRTRENPADSPPPPNLDWEMWTGPAPMRPYNRLIHPRGWRAFQEYGNGILGDMCIHMLDMARWMRNSGGHGEQVERPRHADRDLRFRERKRGVAAPHVGASGRSGLSLGGDLLRFARHAEGERERVRLHPARAG